MSGQQYEMVPEYDSLEGISQGDTKVLNMFRYYESEDTRYRVLGVCVLFLVVIVEYCQ